MSFFKTNELTIERFLNTVKLFNTGKNIGLDAKKSLILEFLPSAIAHSNFYEENAHYTLNKDRTELLNLFGEPDLVQAISIVSQICGCLSYEALLRGNRLSQSQLDLIRFFSFNNMGKWDDKDRDLVVLYFPVLAQIILEETLTKNKSSLLDMDQHIVDRIGEHRSEISKLEGRVNEAIAEFEKRGDYIERIKNKYNFVGLTGAFLEMERQLTWPQRVTFFSLIFLGIFLLAPPIVAGMLHLEAYRNRATEAPFGWEYYALLAPAIISVEVILIYFFRVLLKNYQSIRGQILQLRLRQSLCAFIEKYVEFRKGHADALERFEALIFSGITVDPDNMPSTFDGLEQLTNVVKNLRS